MREAKVAFVAPGQGISSWEDGISLLRESRRTAKIYSQVEEVTGVNVAEVCERTEPVDDPAVVLPAALAVGYARSEVLQHEGGIRPDYLIGLSAGEFTVAAISKALTLQGAAVMMQERGRSQDEVAGGKGGVIIAQHRKPLNLKTIIHGLEAYPSNFHAPNITTFSYSHADYEELIERLKAAGAKVRDVKNLRFPPHGWHVKEAQKMIAAKFKSRSNGSGVEVKDALIPIIATRTGQAMQKARAVKRNLIWQTTQPTRLNEGVKLAVSEGVEEFYDLGPGNSMTKLLGNIITDPTVKIIPVNG